MPNTGILSLFESVGLNDLSEDFKSKVNTIFEAAVSAAIETRKKELEEGYETRLQEQANAAIKDMEVKIDDYLTYVAEEWLKENKLEVDNGIAREISESFMKGLADLFAEHYVEIPEDKVDVVTEMAGSIDTLESERDNAINENIALKKQIAGLQKDKILREMSSGLADSEVDKLNLLVAEVIFEDEEKFREKVCTIAETFLGKTICEGCGDGDDDKKKSDKKDDGDDDDDEDEDDDDKKVDETVSVIAAYMSKKSAF